MTPTDHLNQNANAAKLNQKYFAALAALAGDFANLANISGLKFLSRAPQKFGYDAAVYFHASSGVLVFVNRGTDGFKSFEDWIEGGAAAIAAKFKGPLKASVEFVLERSQSLVHLAAQDVPTPVAVHADDITVFHPRIRTAHHGYNRC